MLLIYCVCAALIGGYPSDQRGFLLVYPCVMTARRCAAPVLNTDSLRSSAHLRNPVGLAGVQMPVSSHSLLIESEFVFVCLFIKKRKVYCGRTWLTCVQEACCSCNVPTLRSLVGMTWLTCAQEVLLPLQLTYVC